MNWLTQKQLQLWAELLKSRRIALKGGDAIPLYPFLKYAVPDIETRAHVLITWMSENPNILSVFVADVSGHNGDYRNCSNVEVELTSDLAVLLTQAVRRGRGHYHCTACGLKVRHPGPSDCCGADVESRY